MFTETIEEWATRVAPRLGQYATDGRSDWSDLREGRIRVEVLESAPRGVLAQEAIRALLAYRDKVVAELTALQRESLLRLMGGAKDAWEAAEHSLVSAKLAIDGKHRGLSDFGRAVAEAAGLKA